MYYWYLSHEFCHTLSRHDASAKWDACSFWHNRAIRSEVFVYANIKRVPFVSWYLMRWTCLWKCNAKVRNTHLMFSDCFCCPIVNSYRLWLIWKHCVFCDMANLMQTSAWIINSSQYSVGCKLSFLNRGFVWSFLFWWSVCLHVHIFDLIKYLSWRLVLIWYFLVWEIITLSLLTDRLLSNNSVVGLSYYYFFIYIFQLYIWQGSAYQSWSRF